MHIEIDSIEDFRRHAATGDLCRSVVQGLDLRQETEALLACSCGGLVLLGCDLEEAASQHVHEAGGLIFPELPNLPYAIYRPALYTVKELLDGYERGRPATYAKSLDQLIYAHSRRAVP